MSLTGVCGVSVGISRRITARAIIYFVSTTVLSVGVGKRNFVLASGIFAYLLRPLFFYVKALDFPKILSVYLFTP